MRSALLSVGLSAAALVGTELRLHIVSTPIVSYRLLAMYRDEEGFIWAGSTHRTLHRYDPRFLYLFDRGSAGLIKWDVRPDTGIAIRYPYATPLPAGGRYEERDNAIWCGVWDLANIASYRPLGLARFDVAKDQFTGWWPFPTTTDEAAELPPYTDPSSVFFVPWTLQGKIVPFDFKRQRWYRPLDVPEHGKRFGFIGGPWLHGGRYYFSLSTYDGDDIGCDGQPYHFCNAILEFDPDARRFDFLTLEANNAYYQVAYMLSAGGEFYVTGSNIREPDGRLDGNRAGEVVFWQTLKVGR